MRFFRIAVFFVICSSIALSQDSRGVITGIISDSAGVAIGGIEVEAVNPDTKAKYQVTTTSTGSFTFSSLPSGRYVISTSATGFKPYASRRVEASAAQTTPFNIILESQKPKKASRNEEEEEAVELPVISEFPGSQSSQWAHNIKGEALRKAPILGFAATTGEGRIRNPLFALQLTPGSLMTNEGYFQINGAPSDTESIRVEGQDINNGILLNKTIQNQVGVDAVEEFTIQTSSYPAEYGQAGSGIVNIAMRSGTNDFHGSVYDYFADDALNASEPYTHNKPQNRRNNYGATLGGPLVIPKNYDGHDKTFMFLNFEQFRQTNLYDKAFTVPTLAYRKGDFRETLTGRSLGTDPLGRSIMEGMIYNPKTERVLYGKRVRDPFPSNIISQTQFDPVAKKIQALIPKPTDTDNSHVTNNYVVPWESPRLDSLGSVKIDQNLGRSKLAFYFGINKETASQSLGEGGDGFTSPVTSGKSTDVLAQTYRLSYERAMSPTRVLHVGLGYQGLRWKQESGYGAFDQSQELGLKGANLSNFPNISGLLGAMGGMKDMGTDLQGVSKMMKPSANTSLTWSRGNHTYKFGAEVRIEGYPAIAEYPAYGSLNFSTEQTGLPSTLGQNLQGGTIGFAYASFLLGLVNNGDIGVVSQPRLGKHAWALFAQDSWKVSRRLTLEYGLRYDYQTYLRDTYGRVANFSPTASNPAADNLPGAMIYEGNGEGRCNCNFAKVYPNAFGPRAGLAFQLSPRIVIRAGGGIIYGQTAADNRTTIVSGSSNPFYSTTYGNAALNLSNGFPAALPWPNVDSSQIFLGSGVSPMAIHPDAGKPPRQIQWSAGIQTEIAKDLVLDIAYVGNRGSSWETNGLVNINALTPERLESLGLDITNADDRVLLTSALNSSLAIQKGYKAPYAAFPLSQTVAQSLRPFPQYGDILYRWAPLGKTWYDSVQVKLTRRYSQGLYLNGGFTYQKEMSTGDENAGGITVLESVSSASDYAANKHVSSLSRPFVIFFAPSYTFPDFMRGKMASSILKDWTLSAVLQYASGLPIHVPISNNNLYALLFQTTYANRVNGADLYTKDINGNSLNPMTDFALNPQAWSDPGAGEFSTSKAYYNDYRFKRRPSEQISVGRIFVIRENLRLSVRADFQNIFNRREIADPEYSNAGATQVKDDDGVPQSGFGYINYKNIGANPRNGQIVVRLQF